jgi:hypothetical protein
MTAPVQLIDATIEAHVSERPVRPASVYLVAAYWCGGHWRVWPDLWTSTVEAQGVAESLPTGWTHRQVIRVDLA